MYTLTAADFADTGQWRMILNIRKDGLDAWLENTVRAGIPPQKLCEVSWEEDPAMLLKHLEEAVYENPRLLDDFATRIILFDEHTLFIPEEITEESEKTEAEIYQQIYDAESSDIMYETKGGITGVWSMGTGIRSFLLRTFPGARLSNNLLEGVDKALKNPMGWHLTANVRRNEADVIVTVNGKLMAASTRKIQEENDLEKIIDETLAAFGINRDNTVMIINREEREE